MHLLKQSTAATVLVGPCLDSSGAAYTGLAVSDLKLSKNGTVGAPNGSATLTHDHKGHYLLALTTTDTNTAGRLAVSNNASTYSMPVTRFEVLAAAMFDSLVTNAAMVIDLTQAVPTSNTAQTVGDALNAARADGFGKWVLSGTTLTLYANDGTTAVRTFTLDSSTNPASRT